MAIILFTAKCYDGSGDIVQAVKIADFLENFLQSEKIEEDIIIVVPDATSSIDHEKAVRGFLNGSKVRVETFSKFKNDTPKINCCIEVAYGASFWRADFKNLVKEELIPVIYMPEYDNDLSPEDASFKILGGFSKKKKDVGVIPNEKLLAATEETASLEEEVAKVFDLLDPKIKKYLGNDSQAYFNYRKSHAFSYQYSHDINEYAAFNNDTLEGEYTPIQFFLQEHIALSSSSDRSQDVLCLGESSERKKEALLLFKDTLIENGYTKVTFVNVDTEREEILHHNTLIFPIKEYRVLYSARASYSAMQILPLLADNFVGATGDQSLVEAMSAGKLVTYECMGHKKQFALGYLEAVKEETSNEKVQRLAGFLIKPNLRARAIEYNNAELMELLKDNSVVDELKKINRKLVVKSQYFETFKNILSSQIKTTPLKEESTLELKKLSKELLNTVNDNKNNSLYWSERYKAALKIFNRVNNESPGFLLTQRDALCIKKQIAIIKANEACWNELPLINKMLDVITFGLTALIRHQFFSDDTKKYIKQIDDSIKNDTGITFKT